MDKKPAPDPSERIGHFVRWFFNVTPTALDDDEPRQGPTREAANDSRQPDFEQGDRSTTSGRRRGA